MLLLNRKASKALGRTLEVDHDNIPEYNDLLVYYIKQFLDADGPFKIQYRMQETK